MKWILFGTIYGFIAVGAGAFGAHGLSQTLSEKGLAVWKTAAEYQMYHALALVALGASAMNVPSAGWAFVIGVLIFSGSLYALALTDIRWLGAITPIGGVAFLAGWALWGWRAWQVMSDAGGVK
jgi:uncharacterized membrane protein YgdD (TMEM256/DUF423 family)